jgi:hypothetical protein
MPPVPVVTALSDHRGWVVAVSVAAPGRVVDRRRIELLDPGIEASPMERAPRGGPVAPVAADVLAAGASATAHAREGLAALVDALGPAHRLVTLLIAEAPPGLPRSLEGILESYRAKNVADARIYRDALRDAAAMLGIPVHPPPGEPAAEDRVRALGAGLGPPWTAEHRLAAGRALVVLDTLG